MGRLLALAKDDGQPPMIPTYGYRQLRSKDKLILVQIFTDLTTGEHLRTTVSQRVWPFLDWLPATEVEMVE
jgi:hypothetical protein